MAILVRVALRRPEACHFTPSEKHLKPNYTIVDVTVELK